MTGESGGSGRPAAGGRPRATAPTVARVREVCQPPEVLARPVEHWTASLYLRRLSPHLTRHLIRAGAEPDSVTALMILTGLLLGPAMLVPGPLAVVLVVLLGQLQMLLDCCDGEVARWRGRSSGTGVFLDKLGHHAAEASLLLGLGVHVYLEHGDRHPLAEQAPALGAAAALFVALNRAVNDMTRASRAASGLPPVTGPGDAALSGAGLVGRARRAASLLPVHRMLHSVELTLLIAAAAVVSALSGSAALLWLLVALVPVSLLVLVGHVAAVLASGRAGAPTQDRGAVR